jgi:hypothetical protein
MRNSTPGRYYDAGRVQAMPCENSARNEWRDTGIFLEGHRDIGPLLTDGGNHAVLAERLHTREQRSARFRYASVPPVDRRRVSYFRRLVRGRSRAGRRGSSCEHYVGGSGNGGFAVGGRGGDASGSSSGLYCEPNGYARANAPRRGVVFSGRRGWQRACTCLAAMDENNNPTSANLGVFVVMAVVPIVVYVVAVLVLPWVGHRFN